MQTQSFCAYCGAENPPSITRGRPRKFCSRRCQSANERLTARMHGKRCNRDGCDQPTRAHGLCGTHYNQTRPNRHKTHEVPCDACGTLTAKQIRNVERYKKAFCCTLCRDFFRYGPRSCDLPRDHIARNIGQTCDWPRQNTPELREEECAWCGVAFTTTKAIHRFCSAKCKKSARERRRRAREHNASGEFAWVDVMRQYRRQGYVCAYCEIPCQGLPDPEHVTPLSRGGRNDMSNIVAACRPCNSDKRDLLLDEWAHDRATRGRAPRRTVLTGAAYLHLV